MPSVTERRTSVGLRVGEFDAGGIYSTRSFTLTGEVWAASHADCMTKIDNLNEWMALPKDVEEFHINGLTVRGLRLEISGHSYSEARYLVVNLSGEAQISGLGRSHFKGRFYNVSIPLTASYPYWISDPISDVYHNTVEDQWVRLPKTGSLGNAEVFPELQLLGPVGASNLSIAHGLFAMNARFDTTARIAGSQDVSSKMSVTHKDNYNVNKTVNLVHGIKTKAVGASESIGAGNHIQLFGNPSSGAGDILTVPRRRGTNNPNTADLPSRCADFINGDMGTFACFFKPVRQVDAGVSGDERTHTFLSFGAAGSQFNQLRIRFRVINDIVKVEVLMANASVSNTLTN